jgi:6-pyruvoyl-tetrahydropterin synthase
MYQAGVGTACNTRHYLVGDFGDECTPHSHEYQLQFSCAAPRLDGNGFAVNIALMEEAVEAFAESMDDVLLNDLPFFQGKQASVENYAEFALRELFAYMKKRGFPESTVSSAEVKVWESETAWASYRWGA